MSISGIWVVEEEKKGVVRRQDRTIDQGARGGGGETGSPAFKTFAYFMLSLPLCGTAAWKTKTEAKSFIKVTRPCT